MTIPYDHYKIPTSKGDLIYGFYNSPIGGFYISYLGVDYEKMELGAFCNTLLSFGIPEVAKAIKDKSLEFKNDEFLNQLYSKLKK